MLLNGFYFLIVYCLKVCLFFKQYYLLNLGDFLLKQRHPIVMLSCLYLKNLVHLCYYYQYLELPVVWIPQAKNSLLLLVEGSESSTTNCQKSFLNVIMLGTKGFWATIHPLWLSCVDGVFHIYPAAVEVPVAWCLF